MDVDSKNRQGTDLNAFLAGHSAIEGTAADREVSSEDRMGDDRARAWYDLGRGLAFINICIDQGYSFGPKPFEGTRRDCVNAFAAIAATRWHEDEFFARIGRYLDACMHEDLDCLKYLTTNDPLYAKDGQAWQRLFAELKEMAAMAEAFAATHSTQPQDAARNGQI